MKILSNSTPQALSSIGDTLSNWAQEKTQKDKKSQIEEAGKWIVQKVSTADPQQLEDPGFMQKFLSRFWPYFCCRDAL